VTGGMDINVRILTELDVITARQRVRHEAEQMGFRSAKVYRLATAVSELAFNLRFHADRGGTIRIISVNDRDRVGIEIVSEDDGPGIPDIELAMQDGYSTNNGLGGGLPGCCRLMDEFSIESTVGVGTKIVARMWRS
jgi:serine/threonine-protein kinase RsbT